MPVTLAAKGTSLGGSHLLIPISITAAVLALVVCLTAVVVCYKICPKKPERKPSADRFLAPLQRTFQLLRPIWFHNSNTFIAVVQTI